MLCASLLFLKQDAFPEFARVPRNDLVHAAMRELEDAHLLSPWLNERPEADYLYREISWAVDHLPHSLEIQLEVAKNPGEISLTLCREKVSFYAGRWRQDFALAINRLAQKLGPSYPHPHAHYAPSLLKNVDQCQHLAADIEALWLRRLPQLGAAPLFRDVPPSHWAWLQVQELQDEGILNGYPGPSPKEFKGGAARQDSGYPCVGRHSGTSQRRSFARLPRR